MASEWVRQLRARGSLRLLPGLLVALLVAMVLGAGASPTAEIPPWQTPYVIKNIAVSTADVAIGPVAAGADYFAFTVSFPDSFNGGGVLELWRSEGTAASNILLEDGLQHISEMVILGDQIIMLAAGADYDLELWRSDGTPGSAALITELVPGSWDAHPNSLTVSGDYAYFVATTEDSEHKSHANLWRTDGTAAGTIRLTGQDLNFDLSVWGGDPPRGLVDHQGTAYFLAIQPDPASPPNNTQLLLRSDGTVAGTQIVATLGSTWDNLVIDDLDGSGEQIVFRRGPRQIWHSDGTTAGTGVMFTAGPSDEVLDLAVAGDKVFLVIRGADYHDSLWVIGIDGTGPMHLRDLGGYGRDLTSNGHRVFFSDTDPDHGCEPWISDGTVAGTFLLKDIAPGSEDGLHTWAARGIVEDGVFYFPARSSLYDDNINTTSGLWRSNGTGAGTWEVPLGLPTNSNPDPEPISGFQGELFFLATDTTHGQEPWMTTNGGTAAAMLGDFNDFDRASSLPFAFNYTNGSLFFATGETLWQTDGSEVGTQLVDESVYNVRRVRTTREEMGVAGDWFYYTAINYVTERTELWRTNGQPNGRTMIGTWETTSNLAPASLLTGVGDLLYFVHKPVYGDADQLWRSDGTFSGTFPVFALADPPGERRTAITEIAAAGKLAYFVIDHWAAGTELLVTDGTVEGTHLTRDIVPDPEAGSDPRDLVGVGDVIYFSADDGIHGRELWRSDGTEAGTVMVMDIRPGPQSSDPAELSALGDVVFFAADDGVNGRELWRSAGRGSDTYMVRNSTAPGGSVPIELTPAQDRLYFMAWDEVNGYQPWRTDGFADTRMIVALEYSEFGWPHDLTAVDNTLYFNVRQSTSIRAYQSDGTAAGTFAHADAFPRFGGYKYREMTAAPGRLFFVAPYTRAGEEPSAQVLNLLRYDQPQLFLPEGAGVHKRYTIALNLRPQAAVTVQISSDDTLNISPSQVTFTPDNWTRPQTITVGAPGGGPATGTRPATLTHTLATADPLLDGETSALPVLIRNWGFGFVPLVMTK